MRYRYMRVTLNVSRVFPFDEIKGEVTIGGNTSLTVVEKACLEGYNQLGKRAFVLEAIRKELRYFAGRQVCCVHISPAWLLARANAESDSENRYGRRKYCYRFPYFGS